MQGNSIKTSLLEIEKIHQPYFSKDFLKSKNVNDIIYEIMKLPINKYLYSLLSFSTILEIMKNLRNTPEIFDNYSPDEKRKVNLFIRHMRQICKLSDKANANIAKITALIEK